MARKLLVSAILLLWVSIPAIILHGVWQKHSRRKISDSVYELTLKQMEEREPLLAAAISQYESGKLIGSDAAQHADLMKQPESHVKFADRDRYRFNTITNCGPHDKLPAMLVMVVKNGRVVNAELIHPEF